MLQNSTGTFTTFFISVAMLSASSMEQYLALSSMGTYQINETAHLYQTGSLISYYNYGSSGFERSNSYIDPIDVESIDMQKRYQSISNSFAKYRMGFPMGKNDYFKVLSNALCKLSFDDNVTSYNEFDESIDVVLRLSNGLRLSISMFLNEDIEAPVVFSIHRGRTLLVSDELHIEDIVSTIKTIVANPGNECVA